jgi:hypothetical protein
MRELDRRWLVTRVKGRQALERRVRALLIAVHRFARCRATSRDDLRWCARTIDGLEALLGLPVPGANHQAGRPGPTSGQPSQRTS